MKIDARLITCAIALCAQAGCDRNDAQSSASLPAPLAPATSVVAPATADSVVGSATPTLPSVAGSATPAQSLGAPDAPGASAPAGATSTASYTCTMHPEIVRPTPGKCPICKMKLVPKGAP